MASRFESGRGYQAKRSAKARFRWRRRYVCPDCHELDLRQLSLLTESQVLEGLVRTWSP
jgi:hypothetical protein